MYVMRAFGCANPAGINLNLGYYALCECITTDHDPAEVLQRWCGLEKKLHRGGKSYIDVNKLRQIMHDRFLGPRQLSEMSGASVCLFYRIIKSGEDRRKINTGVLRELERNLSLGIGKLELPPPSLPGL